MLLNHLLFSNKEKEKENDKNVSMSLQTDLKILNSLSYISTTISITVQKILIFTLELVIQLS